MMNQRIAIRLAQTALRGLASVAEHIDGNLKSVFDQAGLPTPDKSRGQGFATTMRGYAARLDKHLRAGPRK
jgi:hypothetical protein